MSLPPPPPPPIEHKILYPDVCHVPIPHTLYECRDKVTLCGPTGQLHVMAAILEYMHQKEWTWTDETGEHHVKNRRVAKHFTGLPALAILKSTAVLELGESPSSDLREPLWYFLALKPEEVPVLPVFSAVPESFKNILMGEIHKAITTWRRLSHSTDPTSILHLPRIAHREPGVANAYWRKPWVAHHVLARAVPKPDAGLLYRTSDPFFCDIQIPQLGHAVLAENDSTFDADHQPGRQGIFGKPWLFRELSVDSLTFQFLDAAIHLEKALELGDSHPGAKDHRCIELLRIMLIRDLVMTYGVRDEAHEYRLNQVHVAASCTFTHGDEPGRLQAALTHHLSNRTTRAHLMADFVRKYCGGDAPRLMLPGANSAEHKGQMTAECLSTLTWFEEQLQSLTG